ncbi:hypothetical protein B0H19DRAFT_1275629 [Mycena capillaripes]|nr:hypothetical protein B0H19DRAFT_1275629 [Mycena capillaripes]
MALWPDLPVFLMLSIAPGKELSSRHRIKPVLRASSVYVHLILCHCVLGVTTPKELSYPWSHSCKLRVPSKLLLKSPPVPIFLMNADMPQLFASSSLINPAVFASSEILTQYHAASFYLSPVGEPNHISPHCTIPSSSCLRWTIPYDSHPRVSTMMRASGLHIPCLDDHIINIQGSRETVYVAQRWTVSDTSVPWHHKAFHRSCAASSTSFCRRPDGVPECPNRLRAFWRAVYLGHVHSTLFPSELQSDGLAIQTQAHIAYSLTIKEPSQWSTRMGPSDNRSERVSIGQSKPVRLLPPGFARIIAEVLYVGHEVSMGYLGTELGPRSVIISITLLLQL